MKIGVLSDTHNHLDLMRQLAREMIDKYSVDTIVHLGDDSTDADELRNFSVDIYTVPGLFEPRYQDKTIPNRIIRDFEDIPFLLTHSPMRDSHDDPDDIDPTEAIEDGDIKVVLHGHTHKWRIGEEKECIIINPGHMVPKTKSASKGLDPTFAILDLSNKRLDAKILTLSGEVLAEKTFFFNL